MSIIWYILLSIGVGAITLGTASPGHSQSMQRNAAPTTFEAPAFQSGPATTGRSGPRQTMTFGNPNTQPNPGGPRPPEDQIDLSACGNPATVLEECVD